MTMITPSYLGETIEYSSLHACRSTLEDPTGDVNQSPKLTVVIPYEVLAVVPSGAVELHQQPGVGVAAELVAHVLLLEPRRAAYLTNEEALLAVPSDPDQER